jgi:AraC family transcriptional regulator
MEQRPMRIETRRLRAGDVVELDTSGLAAGVMQAVVMPGDAMVRVAAGASVLLLALRGRVEGHCIDGSLHCGPRQWLLLGRDAAPLLQTRERALALLVVVDAAPAAGLDAWRQAVMPSRVQVDAAAGRALRSLRRLLRAGRADAPLLQHCAAAALAAVLAGDGETPALQARAPGRTQTRRRQLLCRMLRARFYIEGHPERIVRIAELARLSSFSPWHFTKTFHQLFGVSPQAYGAAVRLARARALVCSTRLAIGEVAAACGFENACSFARAFHERFGETATQMRARRLQPETPRRRRLAN